MMRLWNYLKAPVNGFIDDDCPTMAAALAYSTVSTLPSLLLIIVTAAGLLLGREAVEGAMREGFRQAIGPPAAKQVQTMVQHAQQQHSSGIAATVLGLLLLAFGATSAFAQLQASLNRVWKVKPDPARGGMKSFIAKRALSFGMILVLAVLLLVSLVASTVLLSFSKAAGSFLPAYLSSGLLEALNAVISFAVVTALFAALYRYLPDVRLAWRDVWVGAAITSVLFVAGKFGVGFYLAHSDPAGGYGAAGSVILILLWTYYSSMIILLGAEFTQTWVQQHGRGIEAEEGAVKVERQERASCGEASVPHETAEERLVVVSNRLPATLKRSGDSWKTEHSAGGLATAMNPILKQTKGIWIGVAGDTSGSENEPALKDLLRRWAERDCYFTVDLPPAVAKPFYEGYSNQTLWPLFHHFPNLVNFSPEFWKAYVEANHRFCDIVVKNYRPGDLIWVHDYHLMILPQMLREALPDARIGFFLHIPFPSSEVFRILPRREELLNGLLGADLLGFHTLSHVQHFRSSVLRILGLESRMDQLEIGNRAVRLEGLPIGIAPQDFVDTLKGDDAQKYRAELDRRFQGRRLLIAVDRLDYTKGIPERLRTFRRLLENSPDLRGHVVLIQVAIPSREDIPSYSNLRSEVNELVGEINGHFSTPDWTPVVYIRRSIAKSQLTALYAAADVGWVTPLRDGMNLVAKEYVASRLDASGALVLSEFAGAAEEMGEAFSVNPYDEERTAATLDLVLSMSERELKARMSALRARVVRNNVFSWADRFLAALREAAASRTGASASGGPARLDVAAVTSAYHAAPRRALFLDYDGTLAGYAPRPEGAVPTKHVLDLLTHLAADRANTTTLVSGRRSADLEEWFGEIPGLWLAAEHGAVVRQPLGQTWQPMRANAGPEWKQRIRPVLENFVDRTPGSLIEEKEYALVWHYRMAEPAFGEWLANELLAMLETMLADTELRAVRGRKAVEVKPVWANKGEVVRHVLDSGPPPQFRFAAGDDRTDEDLFTALDDEAWTLHVGTGPSRARFRVRDVGAVLALLDQFAGTAAVEAPGRHETVSSS